MSYGLKIREQAALAASQRTRRTPTTTHQPTDQKDQKRIARNATAQEVRAGAQ